MRLLCLKCRAPLAGADVNVQTDMAKCASCGELQRASLAVEDPDPGPLLTPPKGSHVTVAGDLTQGLKVEVPPAPFGAGDLFPILFGIFWLGFIAFWTWGAFRASGAFALFSIPFWIVGMVMVASNLSGWSRRESLDLASGTLTQRIRTLFGTSETRIPFADIRSIRKESSLAMSPFAAFRHFRRLHRMNVMTGGLPLATVTHGTRKTVVGLDLGEPEVDWLVELLAAVVARETGRRLTAG